MAWPIMTRETWKTDTVVFLAHPATFLCFWLLGGLLSIFVPLQQWNKENARYYKYYGQYQDNDDGNNNNNNENENNNDDNYYYQTCKWYQWGCKATQYNYNNNGDNNNGDNVPLPTWWIATFGGMDEEERREQEENGETPGALKFVYVWSMLMFVCILAYGVYIILKRRRVTGLFASLFVFTNYAVLSMLMLANGAINDEGRELETTGFYGQFSVLMFMTYFWFSLFGMISALVLGIRAFLLGRMNQGGKDAEEEQDNNAYQSYTAPEVRVGSAQPV